MPPYIVFIIAVAVILLWVFRWLLKRKKYRTPMAILLSVICAPLLYFSVAFAILQIIQTPQKKEFSPEVWQRDKAGRYAMCDIILDNRILTGKTKQQVEQLLGDAVRDDNGTIYYPLDLDAKKPFDSSTEALVINFNDGIVSSVELQ